MAANIIEALEEWITSQTSITDLFPDNVYQSDAPPGSGQQLPSLTFTQETGRIVNIIGDPTRAIQYPEVKVQVQAEFAEDSRSLAKRVARLILSGSQLTWADGREIGRYQTDGEGGELREGIGPDGGDVWEHTIPLIFVIMRD
jgi:hypothetical protein